MFVYAIVGPSGKYIGKTKDPRKRWNEHLFHARTGRTQTHLYRAMRAHGLESFVFEVIWQGLDCQSALEAEQEIIKQEKQANETLYNLTTGGDGTSGHVVSEETRRKIGNANRGRKMSEEQKRQISAFHTGRKYGRRGPMSEKSKRKLSEALRGRKPPEMTPELRQKLSLAATGRKWTNGFSAEHRRKLSEAVRKSWIARRAIVKEVPVTDPKEV